MSILIRGMEMPQGNSTINVLIYADGTVYTGHVNDSRYSAVSVPTPHGRLIDADAFAANLKDISVRQGYKNTLIDEHLTVDDVFDSIIDELTGKAIYGFEYNPTIIEAEGDDNG